MVKHARDPIADAFGEADDRQVAAVAKGSGGSGMVGQVIVFAICLLVGLFVVNHFRDRGDGDRRQDQHEQKQDEQKKDQGDRQQQVAKPLPGWLIVVRERISSLDDDDRSQRIRKYADQQKFAGINLEYRDVDDDDDSEAVRKLIAHAASKSIQPPFVVFKNRETNSLVGVIKLPAADATDAMIAEVFKQ